VSKHRFLHFKMTTDTTQTTEQNHTQALADAGMYVFMG
jgi:hypothetical protein